MVATAISLHLRPHRHRLFLLQNATSSLHFSSSTSSNSDDHNQNQTTPSESQPRSSSSSAYFSDVKASLKQTPPSPQQPRRPSFFNSNPSTREDPTHKVTSLEEIRKNLSEFRRRSSVQPPQSSSPVISFQELYKRNVMRKADLGSGSENAIKRDPASLEAIRMSLKNMRQSPLQSQQPEDPRRRSRLDEISQSLKLRPQSVNNMSSMMPESTGKSKKGVELDEMKTEFVRMYSYAQLGEKLRPEVKGNKNTRFSLAELNGMLRRLREIEEKEIENTSGLKFMHVRESLVKLQDDEKPKKNAVQRVYWAGLGELLALCYLPRRKT